MPKPKTTKRRSKGKKAAIKAARQAARAEARESRPPPAPVAPKGQVAVVIYVSEAYHRFISQAAAQHGLDVGQYLLGRALGGGPMTVTGDFPAAPPPAAGTA